MTIWHEMQAAVAVQSWLRNLTVDQMQSSQRVQAGSDCYRTEVSPMSLSEASLSQNDIAANTSLSR